MTCINLASKPKEQTYEMRLKQILEHIESIAPLSLQENYDNSGLITGHPDMEISGAVLCLDSVEEVIDEAISLGHNLIIAHHPIVFSGLKRFNGSNYIQRVIIKAIKHDIAIYACHTNLDNVISGVNKEICDRLGLENLEILSPKPGQLTKLAVFVPDAAKEKVRSAIFEAGAGTIGDYSECSFDVAGQGTFKAGFGADPFVGEIGERHTESEHRLEVVVENWRISRVIGAMTKAHPYEEVAYDLYPVQKSHQGIGAGMIGDLAQPMNTLDFLKQVKSAFKCDLIKHTAVLKDEVERIAVCGGSGSFLLNDAIRAKADVFITADYKYHQFFDADGSLVIADIGHFESEQFTIDLFGRILREKFPNFALHFTEINTNPVNYLVG